MKTTSFKIWARVIESISYDDNQYIPSASLYIYKTSHSGLDDRERSLQLGSLSLYEKFQYCKWRSVGIKSRGKGVKDLIQQIWNLILYFSYGGHFEFLSSSSES